MGVADDFKLLSADDLATLLTARPELSEPPPATMIELVNRAVAPYSINRAIGGLHAFALEILHGIALLNGQANVASLAGLAQQPPPEQALLDELYRLRTLGLVASRDGVWILRPPVARALGQPFGLGESLEHSFDRHGPNDLRVIAENLRLTPVPGKVGLVRMIADLLRDPDQLLALMRRLPAPTIELLRGAIADRVSVLAVPGLMQRFRVPIEVQQLLSHGLLVPLDWDEAEIPREISLLMLGGKPLRTYNLVAPPVEGGGDRMRTLNERLSPAELVDLLSRLLYRWSEQPASLLKAGGVGVAVMKQLAKDLGIEVPLAARLVTFASMAKLVAIDMYQFEATVTPKGTSWLAEPGASQWLGVVDAWRLSTFESAPFVVGASPVAPLRFDTVSLDAPWRRARLMRALERSNHDGEPDANSLKEHLLWEGAARWRLEMPAIDYVDALVGDLYVLGLLNNGTLTSAATALMHGDLLQVLERVGGEFPQPCSTFTVQADLTAVAPGELKANVAAELSVLADVESRGGATMLRFSEASLRKAMDRGRSPEMIVEFLQTHARPSVPQTLSQLLLDVGRRHGQLRTGPATSYLRAEDPVILAGVVNSKKLSKAKFQLLAPTVAVSELEAPKLLKLLRESGFSPMPEDRSGNVVTLTHDPDAKRVYARELPDHFVADAERAWSAGLAGADVSALVPTTPTRRLADRLRAGK